MGGQASHRSEDVVLTLATEMLRSYGEVRSVVRGASMVPTLFPGDIVVVRRECAQVAHEGDVIFFFRQGFFCAHRLVDKASVDGRVRLIARGDALYKNDPPFAENELLGRVTAVIRCGRRIEFDGGHPAACQRVLRWIVQRSGSSVKWLLRLHSLRARFSRTSTSACKPVEWQPEGAI